MMIKQSQNNDVLALSPPELMTSEVPSADLPGGGEEMRLGVFRKTVARLGLAGLLWWGQPTYALKKVQRRLVFIRPGHLAALRLDIRTAEAAPLARAIEVHRLYFDRFGSKLPARASAVEARDLAALPDEISREVFLWLDPPKEARYCLVLFRRRARKFGVRYAIKRRVLRLKRGQALKSTSQLFRSRDPYRLWMNARSAFFEKDWSRAAALLERLRYLSDSYKARELQDRVERRVSRT